MPKKPQRKTKRRPDALMEYIGVMVEAHRYDYGWTLSDLAAATGIHRNTLAKLEAGEQNVTLGTLSAVADALDTPCADFLPDKRVTHLLRNGRRK